MPRLLLPYLQVESGHLAVKRPLLVVATLFASGIWAGDVVPLAPDAVLGAALGLFVLAVTWRRRRSALLYPLIVATGWSAVNVRTAIVSPVDLRIVLSAEPELLTIRGKLCETPLLRVRELAEDPSWRTMARVAVDRIRPNEGDWRPASGLIAVTTPGALTNLFAGQIVEISGVSGRPPMAAAEGLFDYRTFLRRQDVHFQLRASNERDWQIVASPARPLADRFREWARAALALGLPAEDESLRLEWALTLGWKTALTEEVSEPFIRAATYHIFAVDGLRMAIIFGIGFCLLRAIGTPRAVCGTLLLPLIWFYVALTGWPASAIRASVMLSIIIIGWALKRPPDVLNSLFAAALIILAWDPQQLFQAGFQLSFLVVLCMILLIPPLHALVKRALAPDPFLPPQLSHQMPAWLRGPARYVSDLTFTSLAAWLGSLPLVAYYFNLVTPVSTPANMLAVPLCALVLISNLSALLLASWFPAAAVWFNHAGWFWMELIRTSSLWFARWPKAFFYVAAPDFLTIALYYTLFLAVVTGWLFRRDWRRMKIAGLLALGAFWGWNWAVNQATPRLSLLPLNGADAIFYEPAEWKRDLLVDCGTTNTVQFLTKPFLRARGVDHLPNFVLTHGDTHHIGGAALIADAFAVDRVCISPARSRSPAYRKAIATLGARPGRLRTISRQEEVDGWQVLHPAPGDQFAQGDDNAIVLAAEIRGTKVLLLSDLGRAGQETLLARMPALRADIVVTGLPVRGEPLSEELLASLNPRIIVVADAEAPVSERASRELQARFARHKIPVVYTRSAGTVTIEFRRAGWQMRAMDGSRLCQTPSARFIHLERSGSPHPDPLPEEREPNRFP